MSRLVIVYFVFGISVCGMAQWAKTNGPTGGPAYELVGIGNFLFLNGGVGGVFRSDDDGLTWREINNGLPDDAHCRALVNSGSKIYVSIDRAGVYYSEDFGENWFAINSGIEGLTGYSLFANGNDLYVGSSEGGFYYSANSGNSWSLIQGPFKEKQIRGFVISGNKLFAASDNLFFSTNKGMTWTKLDLGITSVNAIVAVDNTIYVSGGQPLHISRDFGITWTTSNIGTSGGAYTMNAIYAVDDEVYIGASSGTIFHSVDEGENWSTYFSSTIDNLANKIYKYKDLLFLSTNEGIYRSVDNGISWHPTNNNLVNHIIEKTAIDGDTIFVTTSNGLYTSRDNGTSWEKQVIGTKNLGLNHISSINIGNNYILAGTSNGIFKSTDRGNTWMQKLSLQENNKVQVLSGNGNKQIALVVGGTMYTSKDNGESWLHKSNPVLTNNSFNTSLSIGDTIIAGGIDNILISKNFGESWEARRIISEFFYPNSINYHNQKLIVSTFQGIFESSDFGHQWNRIGDFDQLITFNDLKINAQGIFYTATNRGIYVSYNAGQNWYPVNEGLDRSESYAIAFNSKFAFCGTYGGGVWKRSLTNLNVKPKILSLKKELIINTNQTISLGILDFVISDPDNTYPQDFILKIKSGDNYNLSGTDITPSINFDGDLSIKVMVNDGHSDSEEYNAIVKVVVGLNEQKTESSFYPNPVETILYLNDEDNPKYITIFDYLGKEIRRSGASGTLLNEFDLSGLRTGTYLIRIEGKEKFWRIFKN